MADFDRLEKAQDSYFLAGNTRSYQFRIEKLKELKQVFEQHLDEVYDALHADLGKSRREAYVTEVSTVLHEVDYFIRNLKKLTRARRVATPIFLLPSKSYIHHEPLGRVLVISPWNFPFLLSFVPLIGALAGGNCVVLKPSEISSKSSQVMVKIINKCFPPEYVSTILGGAEEATKLLSYRWGHVFFTGSPMVGKIVAQACAQHLNPMTLERVEKALLW